MFCRCGKCDGLNKTHTTKYHAVWQKNPGTFALPDTHPFMIQTKGKPNGGTSGGTAAAATPLSATGMSTEQKSQLASLIKNTQENAESPDFSSFLAGFAKVMGLN